MNIMREIGLLIRKEILLEWRQRYALSGILLYVLSTVFIVYSAFVRIQPQVWNALFWMVMLFASVNAVAKSFVQESGNRQLYYYQLTHPLAVVFSKMIYNSGLLLLLGLLSYAAFSLVGGHPVRDVPLFLQALLLGSLGFSITFTFIAAIASKATNSATLMAILSFPLIIPILMTIIKVTANALGLLQDTSIGQDLLILIAIDLLLVGMTFVLFPFLWRE